MQAAEDLTFLCDLLDEEEQLGLHNSVPEVILTSPHDVEKPDEQHHLCEMLDDAHDDVGDYDSPPLPR